MSGNTSCELARFAVISVIRIYTDLYGVKNGKLNIDSHDRNGKRAKKMEPMTGFDKEGEARRSA